MKQPLIFVLASIALLATACSPGPDYRVEIRRTSYGIPHIQAADLPSLGFGEGYAHAQDHLCSLADQVVRVRSERSLFLGPGESEEHLDSDFGLKALGVYEWAEASLDRMPEEIRGWLQGYVDGYNAYLRATGTEEIPGWCAGEPWVRQISLADMAAVQRALIISPSRFPQLIARAQPPGSEVALAAPTRIPEVAHASNGWAIGSELSSTGGGLLIANPHYPWRGANRFWEKHLTVPGELDVYGVGLIGSPGVQIGFNEHVAWTHTVSAGERFVLYRLALVPGDPTSYRYGDETREMTKRTLSVSVRQPDGTLAEVERDLWSSHYGPILAFPNVGWSEQSVLTVRYANEENDEALLQWLAMDRAGSMDELQAAHAKYQGMPWVNTIATSADGRAWYTDSASTPNLSDEAIALWLERRESDPMTQGLAAEGWVLLDGSDPRFEWVDDPDARDPGVVPFSEMPQLERRDYVFNANDSFWLANSSALIEGDYSPLHGFQRTARSLRTRMNDTTLSDASPSGPRGQDGRFEVAELAAALLHNRGFAAELLRQPLVERCRATAAVEVDGEPVELGPACEVLAQWDGRYDLDSRGAVLFREWITRYPATALRSASPLFSEAFVATAPVETPNTLADGPLAMENLGHAIRVLERAGVALDARLGDMQFADRNGRRIPIHGGLGGSEGIQNMVYGRRNETTLEPEPQWSPVEGSETLTEAGYPISYGTSFLMALQYTDDGPQARAFLTYGQSGDTGSDHYWDQTQLFSRKEWRPILFREDEIAADTRSTLVLEARREGEGWSVSARTVAP